MKRLELLPMPEYHDRYINQCDDVELLEAIQASIDELSSVPIDKWEALGDKTYAPGKWTIRDILQHLIDTERIYAYRALAFARGEKKRLPGYEEHDYAIAANGNSRTISSLLEELASVRGSTKLMFASFNAQMLGRIGIGYKGPYSVASIGFVLPGHQRWHFKMIAEKYLPLLENIA